MFKISNRRYLGCKQKLLAFIRECIFENCKKFDTFIDIFSGTGVVANDYNTSTVKIITNDFLQSNYIIHHAWFSDDDYDKNKIEQIVEEYNNLNLSEENDNYFSINFGERFFSKKVAKKIGYIRDDIEKKYNNNEINFRENNILLTILVYSCDRIANTCGHYAAYRDGKVKKDMVLRLKLLNINDNVNIGNEQYCEDSNELIKKIKGDIIYIDPPYNSRQYSKSYNLLENLITWKKPELEGKGKKMNVDHIKSKYCYQKQAENSFRDLISNCNCKYIVVSYNNMEKKGNSRSNSTISYKNIIKILRTRGRVNIYNKEHPIFNTGKTVINDNKEYIFICNCRPKELINIISPLNYTGAKKGDQLEDIKSNFPKNINKFVDLFTGGLNVGININANEIIVNDNCKELISIFKYFYNSKYDEIHDNIMKIIEDYNLSDTVKHNYEFYNCNSSSGLKSYNKDKYLKLRNDVNEKLISNNMTDNDYLKLFVLIVYGFNNQLRFNKKGGFNIPCGKRDYNMNIRDKLKLFIDRMNIQTLKFKSKDFRQYDITKLNENDFVYADPPYLITSASYNSNWTETEETDLLNFLDELDNKNIKFALSNVTIHNNKENTQLIEWSTKYNIIKLNKKYKNSNYNKNRTKSNQTKTQEVLITNY